MRKSPFIVSLAALVAVALVQPSLFSVARADEVEEEVQSTIPSDPDKRPRSSSSDEEGEWKTMHSESGRGRRVYSGGGSSAVKVDLEKKRLFTPKITFASNSATPTPQSQSVIKQVAATLAKKPELTVRVEGHTDTIGYDQPNLELSQKRADKVRDLLIASGVVADKVQSVGMGDRYPLASSATAEGQEKNRRVEIHIAEVAAPVTPAPEQPAPVTEPTPAPVASAPAPAAPTPSPPVPVAPAPAPAPTPTPQPAPAPVAPAPKTTPAPTPAPVAPAPAPVPAPTPAPAPVVPGPAPLTPPQGP